MASKRTVNKNNKDDEKKKEPIELGLDEVLSILGNTHRREIIKLLAMEDRYAFELARLLNISQRAVSKHLESLSRLNIIRSRWVKSDQGPKRQYFTLDTGWALSISIGPNVFHGIIKELESEVSEEEVKRYLKELRRGKTIDALHSAIREVQEIDRRLSQIEEERIRCLRRKTGVLEALEIILSRLGFSEMEQNILRVLIENNGEMYLTELAQELRKDPQEIREAVMRIRDQEIISVTELGPTEAKIKIQY